MAGSDIIRVRLIFKVIQSRRQLRLIQQVESGGVPA